VLHKTVLLSTGDHSIAINIRQ